MSYIIRVVRSKNLNSATNTFSCEDFDAYTGELLLHRASGKEVYILLYPFDVVFVMDVEGKTVDSWNVPAVPKDEVGMRGKNKK